jgi:hypothetical protein
MDWQFTPDHFNDSVNDGSPVCSLFDSVYKLVAKIANATLARWIDDSRSVYRSGPGDPWHEKRRYTDTQKAKVIAIRSLQ